VLSDATHPAQSSESPAEAIMPLKMSLAAAFCLMLAGCGGSRNDTAADACGKAIADKLAGKNFSLDNKEMIQGAKDESPEVVVIASTVVFDRGLSTEYKQTFDCRVRLENGKPASVIGLQFNWSKDDMKKVNSASGG
jgi:hypothetical protein